MNRKVLFVATVVKAHIIVFHLPYLKMFKELGYEVHVAAKNDYEEPKDCQIPYCDKYFNVSFERSPLNIHNIKAYSELKRIMTTEKYDIVHCHTPVGGLVGRMAAKKNRKNGMKVIYTAHGFHFFKGAPLKNWLFYYPVEKICSFFTDMLITINQEDYTLALNRMKAKKTAYIPGIGIDLRRFENIKVDRKLVRSEIGVPEDAFVLLSVGEINENKNHQIIIRALAKVNNPTIHYVIAGIGGKREYLLKLASELGVANQVHFLGYRNDIPALNYSADTFCFPSYREGLGLAAIEAMACGLPILTSNVHGINDYSIDGVTGYKYAPDDADGFAKGIQNCISNKIDKSVVKIENIKRAKHYDLQQVEKIMRELYRSMSGN